MPTKLNPVPAKRSFQAAPDVAALLDQVKPSKKELDFIMNAALSGYCPKVAAGPKCKISTRP